MEFIITVSEPKKNAACYGTCIYVCAWGGGALCVCVYPRTNRGLVFGVIIMLLCLPKQGVNVFSMYT
jgi:hypothetical protein